MNKRKNLIIIFMLFCLIGIIVSVGLIANWGKDASTNKRVNKKLEKYVTTNKVNEEDSLTIDFEELKKINSDTVGYLKVPSTNVDFVVVKGNDNSFYLKHDFNKEENILGWIFMNYKNKADGSDKNTVIFGHNTPNGLMFGSLANLLEEEHFKDENNLIENNLIIDFYTDKERKKYKIFSVYIVEPEDYYIKTDFEEDEFERFKEKLKERSIHKFDTDIKNKKILTLSTCQKYGTKRLAVHAVEIDLED